MNFGVSFTAFPNPVVGSLMLQTEAGLETVKLYDIYGGLLVVYKYNDQKKAVIMSGFSRAMYIVEVQSAGKLYKKKKIIKN